MQQTDQSTNKVLSDEWNLSYVHVTLTHSGTSHPTILI